MKTLRNLITLVVIISFLIGCAPSEAAIQKAIYQTQTANPPATQTPTPLPTNTPLPTSTPTPEPTATPTITPTPDIRIIDTDPQKLLCTNKELPEEGKYYIPNYTWMSINTNAEVISGRTIEKGRDYVNKTGRVTGWWVGRARGTSTAQLPEELTCGVYMFKTAEGALLALNEYNQVESQDSTGNWKYLKVELNLPYPYVVESNQVLNSSGNKTTMIEMEVVYRNMLLTVVGYASREEDVPLDVLENILLKMIANLDLIPLVDPADAVIAK